MLILNSAVLAMLHAHGLELPLFFFHTFPKLRGMLNEGGVSKSPQVRLGLLQAAVREAPTLSLCGAYADRVRRRCEGGVQQSSC